jgi:predicted pyridoxine 5'-phosphate oxidase superfamily flavin-nucleotide-binding protein
MFQNIENNNKRMCLFAVPVTLEQQTVSRVLSEGVWQEATAMTGAHGRLWLAVALACALQLAASAQTSGYKSDACREALAALQGCNPAMQHHDLQQHCCIPFYAMEGLDCFWCGP